MNLGIRDKLVAAGGKIWKSHRSLALWPWPAIVFNSHGSYLTWDDYRRFAAKIKPGDILVSRSASYFLSNWAISGTFFKHAAVYVGPMRGVRDSKTKFIAATESLGVDKPFSATPQKDVYERTVIHAIGEGVVCQDFGEMFFHADYICAVRPHSNKGQQESIVQTALEQVGKKYDFGFNKHEQKRFYCTELAGYAVQCAGLQPPPTTLIANSVFGLVLPIKAFKTQAWLADEFLCYPVVCASASVEKSEVLDG